LINGASSSSNRSMSSSEAVSVGVLFFSFILHSLRREHRSNSVEVLVSFLLDRLSLNFYALICWILLLWLCMSPGRHQRRADAVPGAVLFETPFCTDPGETGWSGLPNRSVRFGYCWKLATASTLISVSSSWGLFFFAATSSGPFSVSCFTSSSVEVPLLGPV
jgi:hypothetical protein